eukprot:767716-Amphidinium_carterae.1
MDTPQSTLALKSAELQSSVCIPCAQLSTTTRQLHHTLSPSAPPRSPSMLAAQSCSTATTALRHSRMAPALFGHSSTMGQ